MYSKRYIILSLLGFCGFVGVQTVLAADGWVKITTADPACTTSSKDRYVDCGNGSILDTKSGLLWLKNAGCTFREMFEDWDTTTIEVHNLADGVCGLNDNSQPGDWRLPTLREWKLMVAEAVALGCRGPALTDDSGTACFSYKLGNSSFDNVCSTQEFCGYWSATTDISDPKKAYILNPYDGNVTNTYVKTGVFSIWPVRYSQ